MTFLLAMTPILAGIDHMTTIINNLPIGILILEKDPIDSLNEYRIQLSNPLCKKLLMIPKDNNIHKLQSKMKLFTELTPIQNHKPSNLYDFIFNSSQKDNTSTFITPNKNQNLLYIKVKHYNMRKFISVDNYSDERQNLQRKYVQGIAVQYLLTIYHEINNPLNSLIATTGELIGNCQLSQDEKRLKRIELLVFLIQFFLKNFILYFQLSSVNKTQIANEKTTINLENLFKRVSKKFSKLFSYKEINYNENLSHLVNRITESNYYYFKNLIKMIYNYFYHINDKGENFIITAEKVASDKKKIKLVFSNGKPTRKSFSSFSDNDKEKDENTKNPIQTVKMLQELIYTISSFLNIKTEFIRGNNPVIISMIINVEKNMSIANERELAEFTTIEEENDNNNIKALSRPIDPITISTVKKINEKLELSSINNNHFHYRTNSTCFNETLSGQNDINLNMNMTIKNSFIPKKPGANIFGSMIKNITKNSHIISNDNDLNKSIKISHSFIGKIKDNQKEKINAMYIEDNDIKYIEKFKEDEKENYNNYYSNDINNTNIFLFSNNHFINNNAIDNVNNDTKHFEFENRNSNLKEDSTKSQGFGIDEKEIHNYREITVNPVTIQYNFERPLKHPRKKKGNDLLSKDHIKTPLSKFTDIRRDSKYLNQKQIKPNYIDINIVNNNCNCRDVLIVDDEEFNQICLSNLMQQMNIKSDLACNGRECIDKLKEKLNKKCNCEKREYKLVLMDVLMPKMTGLEAAKELQDMVNKGIINSKLNIIIISACVDHMSNFTEIKKNIPILKEFLLKPLKRSKLKEILNKYYLTEG